MTSAALQIEHSLAEIIPLNTPAHTSGLQKQSARVPLFRRFTDEDYGAIARAVLDARDMAEEDYQRIGITDAIPGVDIIVERTVRGYWTTGGSYDYGMSEQIWEIASEEFRVDEFEHFNKAGNEIPHDFDNWRLESILNRK